MEEQALKFEEKLKTLVALGRKKKNVLEVQEINEVFSDMPLEEEHFSLIYDYLAQQNIRVTESEEEAAELPDEEKREYAYYEWNNFGDEYGIYYEIYSKITALLDWFGEGDAFGEDSRYSADSISFSQVRVWVYVS